MNSGSGGLYRRHRRRWQNVILSEHRESKDQTVAEIGQD
jgi:hypothetical protein